MTKFKIGDRVVPIPSVAFLISEYDFDKIIVVEINDYHSFSYPIKCELSFNDEVIELMSFKESELQKFSPFSKIKSLL